MKKREVKFLSVFYIGVLLIGACITAAENGYSKAGRGRRAGTESGPVQDKASQMQGMGETAYFFGDVLPQLRETTYTDLGSLSHGKVGYIDLSLVAPSYTQIVNFQDADNKSRAYMFMLLSPDMLRDSRYTNLPASLKSQVEGYNRVCLFFFGKSSDPKYGSKTMWAPLGVMTSTAASQEVANNIDDYIPNLYINKNGELTAVYKDVLGRGDKMVGKKTVTYKYGERFVETHTNR